VVLHHRVAAAIAMLVAQALEDPLGRVALLDRGRAQPRVCGPARSCP
jgi:hypothetical protein